MLLYKGQSSLLRQIVRPLSTCHHHFFSERLIDTKRRTHNFITAAGTTGNTATGDYQLADGRKGNLYRGPWPRPTTGQGAATSVLVESIAVSNTAATTVEENIAVQTSGAGFSAGAAGATSTGANSGGPVATSAGASPPLATHNGALRIQQPANAVWGIGALIAWAILP
jgi:hypothetical protein